MGHGVHDPILVGNGDAPRVVVYVDGDGGCRAWAAILDTL
jgi:hypothetical protein